MSLFCWGSGELGQTGHGRPGDIGPEKAFLREFTEGQLGRVKLLACGSSHSIVITGMAPSLFVWFFLGVFDKLYLANCMYFTGKLFDNRSVVGIQSIFLLMGWFALCFSMMKIHRFYS